MNKIQRGFSFLVSIILGYTGLKLIGIIFSFLQAVEGKGDVGAAFGGAIALILPSTLLLTSVCLLFYSLTGKSLLR